MEKNKEQQPIGLPGNIMKALHPARLTINQKILAVIAGNLLVIMVIILLVAYSKQRSLSIKSAYATLSLVETMKVQQLESELNRLQNQLQLFSSDSRTLGAFSSLWQAFRDIESDNYTTPEAATVEQMKQSLKDYYLTQLMPVIEDKSGRKYEPETFLTDDPKQVILQYLYLAYNQKPLGYQHQVTGAGDGSLYSGMHVQHQPWLLGYASQNRINDILFVDAKTGYVFYSLRKNPDYATNLLHGPFKNSSLANGFRHAVASSSKNNIVFSDADEPMPGIYTPSFYVSAPVLQGNQVIGAIIYGIETGFIDKLLATSIDDEYNPRPSLSTLLIGQDLVYRCNDPDLSVGKNRYLKRIRRHSATAEMAGMIERSGNTTLKLEVKGDVFASARMGIAGRGRYVTPAGNAVLCSYIPVNKSGLNWIILGQVKTGEVLKSARTLVKFLLVFGIIGFSGLIYLSIFFSSRLAGRAHSLKNALLSLAEGHEQGDLSDYPEDELGQAAGAVMALKKSIREAADFAARLSEGNLTISVAAVNDHYTIGNSLIKLRESMLKTRKEEEIRKVEDEVRNWTTQGIAMFNDILRQDNNDIKKLSFNILKNLIQYLSANQGGFFLLEEQQGEGQYLRLVSAYAFDRQKFLQKKIRVGEGLAGNCVQEKHTIHLKDIPEDYIEITSGLGGAAPRSLLLVPLKKEDQITGMIELASFNEFRKHEIEFVEKVAESIASTMVTVSLHEQTAILLEESKKRSEEVSQQEEELRQNLEELKATQEEMARIRKDEEQKETERKVIEQRMLDELKEQQRLLSKEKSLLDALLSSVNESIYFKDLESRFIRFSGSMLKIFKLKKAEEMTGKSDFDFFDEEHARPAYEDEQTIIMTGTPMVDKVEKEVYADGRVNYVNTTKMPLRDEQNKIIGTFGISKDVTRFVNMEQEIEEKNSQLQKLEEEIMRLKAALEKARKDKTGA